MSLRNLYATTDTSTASRKGVQNRLQQRLNIKFIYARKLTEKAESMVNDEVDFGKRKSSIVMEAAMKLFAEMDNSEQFRMKIGGKPKKASGNHLRSIEENNHLHDSGTTVCSSSSISDDQPEPDWKRRCRINAERREAAWREQQEELLRQEEIWHREQNKIYNKVDTNIEPTPQEDEECVEEVLALSECQLETENLLPTVIYDDENKLDVTSDNANPDGVDNWMIMSTSEHSTVSNNDVSEKCANESSHISMEPGSIPDKLITSATENENAIVLEKDDKVNDPLLSLNEDDVNACDADPNKIQESMIVLSMQDDVVKDLQPEEEIVVNPKNQDLSTLPSSKESNTTDDDTDDQNEEDMADGKNSCTVPSSIEKEEKDKKKKKSALSKLGSSFRKLLKQPSRKQL